MKINRKRFSSVIALILAFVTTVGILAGCGGKEEGTSGDGVLKIYHFKNGTDILDDQEMVFDELNKILKEKIGRTIEVEFIDIGAYKEKMQMIFASREEFDLCFTGYLYANKDAREMGALMNVKDLIDKETPALKAALKEEYWKSSTAPDGGIYFIQNDQIRALGHSVDIRKDLADEYGLNPDEVHSYDDLKPFLTWVKETHPELYPTRGYIVDKFMEEPMRSAYTSDLIYYYWDDAEFKVCTEEPFYEMALHMHRIYTDGFRRPDIATYTDDNAEFMAGKYAVMKGGDKPGAVAELESQTGYEWYSIRASQGVGGSGSTGTEWAVSATSKDPVGALKFLELMMTDKEVFNMFLFGLEGVHYNKLSENRIELIEDSGYNLGGQGWKFGCAYNAYLLPGQADDTWELTKQRNDEAPRHPLAGIRVNIDHLQTELAQCLKVKNEYKNRVERGYEHPDTYWAEYTRKMEEAGIEKIREAYNAELKNFLASKNK